MNIHISILHHSIAAEAVNQYFPGQLGIIFQPRLEKSSIEVGVATIEIGDHPLGIAISLRPHGRACRAIEYSRADPVGFSRFNVNIS